MNTTPIGAKHQVSTRVHLLQFPPEDRRYLVHPGVKAPRMRARLLSSGPLRVILRLISAGMLMPMASEFSSQGRYRVLGLPRRQRLIPCFGPPRLVAFPIPIGTKECILGPDRSRASTAFLKLLHPLVPANSCWLKAYIRQRDFSILLLLPSSFSERDRHITYGILVVRAENVAMGGPQETSALRPRQHATGISEPIGVQCT